MKIIALEYSHIDWAGRHRIDNYIPVDSMETGLYLAQEALKEEKGHQNTVIEHPSDNIWIIKTTNPYVGERTCMISVTERTALTMADVKSVVNGK